MQSSRPTQATRSGTFFPRLMIREQPCATRPMRTITPTKMIPSRIARRTSSSLCWVMFNRSSQPLGHWRSTVVLPSGCFWSIAPPHLGAIRPRTLTRYLWWVWLSRRQGAVGSPGRQPHGEDSRDEPLSRERQNLRPQSLARPFDSVLALLWPGPTILATRWRGKEVQ